MELKVNNLHFAVNGKHILQGIDCRFVPGKFYAVAGPNGSGKSTLLKCLVGLEKASYGTIHVGDRHLHELTGNQRAVQLAYIPQQSQATFGYSVIEFVEMGFISSPLSTTGHESPSQTIEKALRLTDLKHLKHQSIQTLSGGELQRAVIARTLVQNSPLMLLDEPFSQLDIRHQQDMLELLKHLCAKHKKTVICILHDFNQMLMVADEVLMMDQGKVAHAGKAAEVLSPENIRAVFGVDVAWTQSAEYGVRGILPRMRALRVKEVEGYEEAVGC